LFLLIFFIIVIDYCFHIFTFVDNIVENFSVNGNISRKFITNLLMITLIFVIIGEYC